MTRKPTGRLCRIIGCDSLLGRWFEWPHKLCDWLYAEPELSSLTGSYGSPN